ncbi:MAG: bifunctional riboflavin kinase/FAD synthetase [Actinobacteria bacterium]|nr:bifunctional riboflavin kinase/FAD synthetase [Actinomycetota bacterium]
MVTTRVVRLDGGDSGAPLSDGSVVTIGAYDGLHLGHWKVLQLVRELADARSLDASAVTFDRHPAQVVRPASAPLLLSSLEQKLELLVGTDLLDLVCVMAFDDTRSKETAEEFVQEVLVDLLRVRVVVVGADFHFGHRRRGNVALLEHMGTDLGFEVLGLGLVAPGSDPAHEPYSSTSVRGALATGDVGRAAGLLGRLHEVRGTVVAGDRRGRELGFPTANVALPPETCLPVDGIYAGYFRGVDERWRPCVISLGRRPTFYDNDAARMLEAYLLDFDGDLYDQAVAVRFLARIRDQRRFASVDELVAAITADVARARVLLARA